MSEEPSKVSGPHPILVCATRYMRIIELVSELEALLRPEDAAEVRALAVALEHQSREAASPEAKEPGPTS